MAENQSCYEVSVRTGLFYDADFWTLWMSAIPLVTLCVITITANGAIILMFATKLRLRKCRNTYIMSLAIADFMIGLTLPLSIVETIGEKWILSDNLCTAFLTIRYSLHYVTILSIVLITLDRWWSVNFPFSYRIRRSKKMAFSLVSIVWVLSFAIHIPTITGWKFLHVRTVEYHNYCRVPYEYNPGFTISASVIEFFIPLLILISLNMGLYIKLAKRRNSKTLRRSLSTSDSHAVYGRRKSSSDSDNTNNSDDISELLTAAGRRRSTTYAMHYKKYNNEKTANKKCPKLGTPQRHTGYSNARCLSLEYASLISNLPRKYSNIRKCSRASISSKTKSHDDVVRDYLIIQDNKALLLLGLLVIMFIICWTPSILCDIIYAICPGKVPLWMLQCSYWILALNSALNPFLYGIGSSEFRRVAKSWFYCIEKKNFRVLETLLFNQLIQPCDRYALKELEISGQTSNKQMHFV